jgi:hypothetical protein
MFIFNSNKMNLEKHLKRCTWNEIRREFINIGYKGAYIRAFKRAFYELKTKVATPNSRVINLYKDDIWAFYSHSKEEEEFIEMIFVPWGECLGMNVIIEKGAKMSSAKVVMRCLWTITYFGFSEAQIKKKLAITL